MIRSENILNLHVPEGNSGTKIYSLRIGILLFLSVLGNVLAQNVSLSGKVIDEVSSEPIRYVNIAVQNTKIGTTSDSKGTFYLELPINSRILFSCVGYKTKELTFNKGLTNIVVTLQPISYLLQEVSVYNKNQSFTDISAQEMENIQIRNFTGMTKDAIRSIQLLPGISVNNEASSRFNVRGGSHDENMILIDGVEVYTPYHFKEIEMASIGIFNIDMVKQIDFCSGGFSSEYGNALSSLLRIDYYSGNREKFIGKADLSLIDLSLNLQGPVDPSSSYIISLRKSYLDYLMKLTSVNPAIDLSYYDLQGKMTYDLNKKDKISATIIYSHDDGDQEPTTEQRITYSQGSVGSDRTTSKKVSDNFKSASTDYNIFMSSVKYSRSFSNNILGETLLYSYYETEDENVIKKEQSDISLPEYPVYFSHYTNNNDLSDVLKIHTLAVKQNFTVLFSPYYSLKSGISYKDINYNQNRLMYGRELYTTNTRNYPDTTTMIYPPDPQYNDTTHLNTTTYRLEGYLSNSIQFLDNIVIEAGLRLDYLDINKELKISPRINLSTPLPLGLRLRLAWGIFYQAPSFRQLRKSMPGSDNTSFQKATHYILGIEKVISERFNFRAEYYYKVYDDLIQIKRLGSGELAYGKKKNDTKGFAYGFDLQCHYGNNILDFWFSYGWLVAKEKLKNSMENYRPRYTDQRHTLSSIVKIDLGKKWEMSGRAFYGSGYAFTPYVLGYNESDQSSFWKLGEKNSAHYPAYLRFDFRISKLFDISGNNFGVYLDVMNIFNRKNIITYRYTYNESGEPIVEKMELFPILPTLGITYSF